MNPRSPSLLLAVILASTARAGEPEGSAAPEVLAERDRLIGKIARGEDPEVSTRRYAALRAQVMAVHDAEVAQKEKQRAAEVAQRAWKESWRKSADHAVSWRCALSPDPAHPLPSGEGGFRGDWGKVLRRQVVTLPPKNALDEGERWTLVEVAGIARRYALHDEVASVHEGTPLGAQVGDLVLVCADRTRKIEGLPPPWAGSEVSVGGFAVRIAAPPKIAQKARWNPIQIGSSKLYWAIHDVKWKYPPDAFVLASVEIAEDLGGGRYRVDVDAHRGFSWVLEAPPSLPRRELLIPGRAVWAILGHARFDRELKKLVLVAEDIEEHYVTER